MRLKLMKKRPITKESKSWYKRGDYKGYSVSINYNEQFDCFYFQAVKGEYNYFSLWDNNSFKSESECAEACVKHIDEVSA